LPEEMEKSERIAMYGRLDIDVRIVFARVPTLLLAKKSRTFPGLSRTSKRNFPGSFRSPRMIKYNEKNPPLSS